MARDKKPTIPDDKILYFTEQLYNQLEHMFEWKNLPTTITSDYLERNLVRRGRLLFLEHEDIGMDVLPAIATGFNRHGRPTDARTFTPNTSDDRTQLERKIKRQTDGTVDFNRSTDGVLIDNLYGGESSKRVVDFFANRLALAYQAFDTQLLYANLPYIFLTSDPKTRLSIEGMFSSIFNGEPFIITDKGLMEDNKDRAGVPTNIQYKGSEIMDSINELNMKFREAVGFDTAGVDKKERLLTGEIESNEQHTRSVLEIMLRQREIAVADINAFFGTNIIVQLTGTDEIEGDEQMIREGDYDGDSDNRIEEAPAD